MLQGGHVVLPDAIGFDLACAVVHEELLSFTEPSCVTIAEPSPPRCG
jgi:hypothetical protein